MGFSTIFRLIISALALILLQVLILNNLEFSRYLYPQVYILILMTIPVNQIHWQSYLIAFVTGIIVDGFTNTPGLHASVCLLMVFLRYVYLNNFADKEWVSSGIMPSFSNMDKVSFLIYTALFSTLFHFILFNLEHASFKYYTEVLLRTLYSSSMSIMLILLLQFTFSASPRNE